MKRVLWTAGILLPLIGVGVGLLWLSRPATRPNILLITVDTLRPDHLGCYGYERPTSPRLDELARQGVVFDGALTQATLSGPAHATLFTGLAVPAHGVINNAVTLRPEHFTVAEFLKAVGYETAMFVSHPLVSDEFGFDQGFDTARTLTVDDHGPHHRHEEDPEATVLPPDAVFVAAGEWMRQPRERPFFVWLHIQHVHKSYDPPAPYDRRFRDPPPESPHDLRCHDTLELHQDGEIRLTDDERDYVVALYDGEIAYVDEQIGKLLDDMQANALEESTVVVLTADHGEMLFDDAAARVAGHGRHRTEPVLRIPLIVRGPGIDRGSRVPEMVGLIDLNPTLLALAGVSIPGRLTGRDLGPLLRAGTIEAREANYTCTVHTDGAIRLSLRTRNDKLVCDKRKERLACAYFDLIADPGERRNAVSDPRSAERVAALRASLEDWFREQTGHGRLLEVSPPSKRARRLLERAGYLERTTEP